MISNTGCQWLRNTNMYICTTCNPLKFTKIIHLPRQIYVSNIKQIRDIIEARSFSDQPKTESIPGSSTDKPLEPDPQRDEVNNQDEIYVEEEYFDCEEFLAEANSYNNQVARAVAKEHAKFKLVQAEVVRKLGEYAIVYIGVIRYKVKVVIICIVGILIFITTVLQFHIYCFVSDTISNVTEIQVPSFHYL